MPVRPRVGLGRSFVLHAALLCLPGAVGIAGACTHVLGGLGLLLAIVVRRYRGLVGGRAVSAGIRGPLPPRFARRDRRLVLEGALAPVVACTRLLGPGIAGARRAPLRLWFLLQMFARSLRHGCLLDVRARRPPLRGRRVPIRWVCHTLDVRERISPAHRG
ncbi:hypothetical protein GS534_29605 [Rhodococcus hoagii]|nr:hypothetical protein [Prescottella equi]